jgi:hypothetical protein
VELIDPLAGALPAAEGGAGEGVGPAQPARSATTTRAAAIARLDIAAS